MDFLHIDLGNIVSWVILLVVWYTAAVRQTQLWKDQVDSIREWIRIHESEATARDTLIRDLGSLTAQMGATMRSFEKLSEMVERRIERLEDRERHRSES